MRLPFFSKNLILPVAICVLAASSVLIKNARHSPVEYMEAGLKAYDRKNYGKALSAFLKAEEAGVPEAMFVLGNMYINGYGVPKDVSNAISYYRRAGELRYTPALFTMALLYMDGTVVPQDIPLAHTYISKAAQEGDTEAMTTLALWYERGYFGRGKFNRALYWYKKAARLGDTNAQTALSMFYAQGMHGLQKDYYESRRWTKALEQKQAYTDRFSGKIPQSETGMNFTLDQLSNIPLRQKALESE